MNLFDTLLILEEIVFVREIPCLKLSFFSRCQTLTPRWWIQTLRATSSRRTMTRGSTRSRSNTSSRRLLLLSLGKTYYTLLTTTYYTFFLLVVTCIVSVPLLKISRPLTYMLSNRAPILDQMKIVFKCYCFGKFQVDMQISSQLSHVVGRFCEWYKCSVFQHN